MPTASPSYAEPRQLTFTVLGKTFAAQAWGRPTNPPVLALHGWLDNSASFFRLAPLLEDYYVVAVDMAGHGLSDHRGNQEPYNIWQDVGEVFGIADALGWEQFMLLGHSRGATISTLCAGTFPQRVTRVALLDGCMPEPLSGAEAPQQLAKSILDSRSVKPHSLYQDRELMIRARMMGMWALSREAATALIDRGVVAAEGGYYWRADPCLSVASVVRLDAEQIAGFVDNIRAPVQLLLADQGLLTRFTKQLPDNANWIIRTLPGSHHFHMEEQAEAIAGILKPFFAGQAASAFTC